MPSPRSEQSGRPFSLVESDGYCEPAIESNGSRLSLRRLKGLCHTSPGASDEWHGFPLDLWLLGGRKQCKREEKEGKPSHCAFRLTERA